MSDEADQSVLAKSVKDGEIAEKKTQPSEALDSDSLLQSLPGKPGYSGFIGFGTPKDSM